GSGKDTLTTCRSGMQKICKDTEPTWYSSLISSVVMSASAMREPSSSGMYASSVIQNGPAFFDRTSSASSPSVRCASLVSEAMARTHLQAEHPGRRVDVDDVVEHELVRRAAIDVGGGGGKREAGQVVHRRQGQVQQERV